MPRAEVGPRPVGRLEELEDGGVRIGGRANRVVGQQELAGAIVEERVCRTDGGTREAIRFVGRRTRRTPDRRR